MYILYLIFAKCDVDPIFLSHSESVPLCVGYLVEKGELYTIMQIRIQLTDFDDFQICYQYHDFEQFFSVHDIILARFSYRDIYEKTFDIFTL